MKVVIASGKGGTGKTTLAVNLAAVLAGQFAVGLLDCDVEEPNVHLFVRPTGDARETVGTPIPVIDSEYCTGCGLCASACEFNALLALPGRPLLLPELCHSCGVCSYVPRGKRFPRPTGRSGSSGPSQSKASTFGGGF